MAISLTVAGIDLSDYLIETLSIEAEEGRSVVAAFSICDANKLLDHDDLWSVRGGNVPPIVAPGVR